MARNYETFDDFLEDLDRSGNFSDDPFEVDAQEMLDEDDLALLNHGPKPKTTKNPPKRARKPKSKERPPS